MKPVAPAVSSSTLPWADGAYSVKRHGVTIASCDSEPVQTPGCIQSHGVLFVLRPADLVILQVSESSHALLGLAPNELLGRSVSVVIGESQQVLVRQLLDQDGPDDNPVYVVTIPARRGGSPLDVTVHTVDGIVIVELEATGRGDGVEPDYVGLLQKTVARLQSARTLGELSHTLAVEVRALTGFDRVMVYRFHEDHHGEVFAESHDPSCVPWLGLHYPAEDIPKPARAVFAKTWCRPLPDVAGSLAELVPLVHPETGRPLTMTHCALRGASVMYTEYLQNMRVTAGLTMALREEGKLWGLVACHHYAGARHLGYPVRAACEFVAQIASLQLPATASREHLLDRLRIESVHNDLVARAVQDDGLAVFVDDRSGMLDGLDAGGAAVFHDGRWRTVGLTPDDHELDELAVWLEQRPELRPGTRRVFATDRLSDVYPAGAAFAESASGLLVIALSRTQRDLMLWFRPETPAVVDWAGDPHDKPTTHGPHGPRLTPRASFDRFRESVKNRSLPWLTVEIDAAARLRILVMDVIVGRSQQLAELNADLTRSNEDLDTFAYVASHDLKEPLRSIQHFTHQLLADSTRSDEDQRQKLEVLMRLTVRMDGLLDSLLHFSQVGRAALAFEVVDLDEVVREALEIVGFRTAGPNVQIVVERRLPDQPCDRIRVREIFVNLLSNALKYSDASSKRIEVGYLATHEAGPRPGAAPEATRQTIFFVKDNGIGIAARHLDDVFKIFRRLHAEGAYGGGNGAGLTIVQKLVERHGGRVWFDSTPDVGSTCYFTLAGDTS